MEKEAEEKQKTIYLKDDTNKQTSRTQKTNKCL